MAQFGCGYSRSHRTVLEGYEGSMRLPLLAE